MGDEETDAGNREKQKLAHRAKIGLSIALRLIDQPRQYRNEHASDRLVDLTEREHEPFIGAVIIAVLGRTGEPPDIHIVRIAGDVVYDIDTLHSPPDLPSPSPFRTCLLSGQFFFFLL